MKFICIASILLAGFASTAAAHEGHDHGDHYDPRDGVIKLYGAGGPHSAIQKVADVWQQQTGTRVELTYGPETTWTQAARQDADIIWGTAEQSMTAFLQTYTMFNSDQVEPIYIRPAVIAVQKGNPRGIEGFDDLLADDISIVVTEGAGVSNTSGTGVWEDIAGRLGNLEDVIEFRRNIVAFRHGSGASFKAFQELDADAWITWPDWPARNPDSLEAVALEAERAIWRDLNVVVSPEADPEARAFLDFLISEEAQPLMASEGWVR
ncbi:extracellular solute-binding protein [Halomonas huangheensis]|uniref:Accessory colonization factor n=1 Tax=Halomonas huangheensis TaxID=1178482 RepID=W1N914_9GAMM|nr:extracellular solute-binding protein [Halomonas huangheensis]ALM53233.1 accessory colonization factor [Halomonas huangheensis]ERL51400.1 hypothetical protein BJB45_13355 [Halomonas huangheensis]